MMTKEKIDEITTAVADMVEDGMKIGMDGEWWKFLDMITSLHNELYKEVTGKYYDYMFHWANLGYGGCPDDGLFKENKDEHK